MTARPPVSGRRADSDKALGPGALVQSVSIYMESLAIPFEARQLLDASDGQRGFSPAREDAESLDVFIMTP